ncbi:MAG: hypothetical protein JWP91_660 [Fibrobacteres bacterium]|nr:hypothetical protein [Fibrobacterota bacterium]
MMRNKMDAGPKHPTLPKVLVTWCLLTVVPGWMGGCMTNDSKGTETNDLFPKPLGETIIPLSQEAYSNFNYVEFDSAGGLVMRRNLTLYILPKAVDVYGYAFEDPRRGFLLKFDDANGNRDSAGIYIVGTYRDSTLAYDSVPVLWLPQLPKRGVKWSTDPGRQMELVSPDTSFYTAVLFPWGDETGEAPIQYGFQRQPALLFRETAGDTITYYNFRRGVGCLGFERAVNGKLVASGVLQSFSSKYRP